MPEFAEYKPGETNTRSNDVAGKKKKTIKNKWFFVALAGVLGLLGIVLATIILFVYLSSMDSFGTAYLSPFAPLVTHDLQDGFIKAEVVQIKTRPYTIPTSNRVRMKIKNAEKVDTGDQNQHNGEQCDD